MVNITSKWEDELARWLAPFLARLGHKARRRMCPLYVAGLIGPGDRKSVAADGGAIGAGRLRPVASFHCERRLGRSAARRRTRDPGGQADRRSDAVLVVDDTALPKKGIAFGRRRAAIRLGARQDRQLPDAGVADAGAGRGSGDDRPAPVSAGELDPRPPRMAKARVPETWRSRARSRRSRWPRSIAIAPRAFGLRLCAGRCRLWPVRAVPPGARRARPEVGGRNPQAAESLSEQRASWCFRLPGAGGRASAISPISFPLPRKPCSPTRSGDASAGVREPRAPWRPPSPPCACGSPMVRHNASMTRACSTCQAKRPGWSASVAPRASANTISPTCLPSASLKTLAAAIKARWVCEQAHQQLKEELGLDHFEGRSWHGLHRHALMTMIAYAYLQARRLAQAGRKKRINGPPPQPSLPAVRHAIVELIVRPRPQRCPHCRRQISEKQQRE